ncbi:hypothetical protein DIPPA_01213 [Diplonema papillatum]|nr:hypothetical protein DIPPA_11883 [Diplonema papillatum]KAJ9435987.1 hypothetical protein DIPPA_01213 [Diplonema papillatum]
MQLVIAAFIIAATTDEAYPKDDPCLLLDCEDGFSCHVVRDSPKCYADCATTCGKAVPHKWSGSDDGGNACNECTCNDGALSCTKKACSDAPCPQDVCKDKATCGGIVGTSCDSRSHVCIDDPADDCNPKKGGSDCIGCCVFNECILVKCSKGFVCELNWHGEAECVAVE